MVDKISLNIMATCLCLFYREVTLSHLPPPPSHWNHPQRNPSKKNLHSKVSVYSLLGNLDYYPNVLYIAAVKKFCIFSYKYVQFSDKKKF